MMVKKLAFLMIVLIIQPVKVLWGHPHYVIIANGPSSSNNLARKYKEEATIVALDGAANHLVGTDLTPHFILGDFDSITQKTKKHFQDLKVSFISRPDQSMTDLEKGIQFCAQRGAKTITVICALGGDRNDHSFSNLSLLRRHHGKDYKIALETEREVIEFLKNEVAVRKASVGGKFGLFGFPKAIATVDALEWPLNNFPLEMGWQESACNTVKESLIKICISGEALVIWPR